MSKSHTLQFVHTRTVWKFGLEDAIDDEIVIYGFLDPTVVFVAAEGSIPAVWIEHGPTGGLETERHLAFTFIGTGHDVPKGWQHIGSCQAGPFVWHVYMQDRS